MLKLAALLACFVCCASIIRQAAGAERAVFALLDNGARVLGIAELPDTLALIGTDAASAVNASDLLRIVIGERIDPNLQNDALVAVDDLQSADFATREKAVAKIRALGRAAAVALRKAISSVDADTARQARGLLTELGLAKNADELPAADIFETRDGKKLRGDCGFSELALRSRWGKFKIPIESLKSLEFLPPSAAADALRTKLAALPQDSGEVALLANNTSAQTGQAVRWDPFSKVPRYLDRIVFDSDFKDRFLRLNQIIEEHPKKNEPVKWVVAHPGDKLEATFLARGIVAKATENNSGLEVHDTNNPNINVDFHAIARNSDVEFSFVPARNDGSAGVYFAGMSIHAVTPGTVGLAAFDATGRLLGQTLNQRGVSSAAAAPQPLLDEFLGLSSHIPIARLKLFRAGTARERNDSLEFTDFVFDRPVSTDARAGECLFFTRDGERFSGTPEKSAGGYIALKTDWLGVNAPPPRLALDEIARYEPARAPLKSMLDATILQEHTEKIIRQRKQFLRSLKPHAVTLQSGETFRAHLLALNESHALLALARGVEIKLPSAALKKVVLIPDDDEKTAPKNDAADKPGVLLKIKAGPGSPGAPLPPPEENKDPARNPAQGTDRIDDAEIAGVDPKSWMLILKDENGNTSEIGMPGVKALIFPASKEIQAPTPCAWTLAFDGGSRVDADLISIEPDAIKVRISGGEVLLPPEVVDFIERKK